jgi:predicted DNA-binding protein
MSTPLEQPTRLELQRQLYKAYYVDINRIVAHAASMKPERKVYENADGSKSLSVSARFDSDWYTRLTAVAEATRRTPGGIIKLCVEDHLPLMEKEIGIEAGRKARRKTLV